MIVPCAGNAVQDGYLLCDGSAISRTLYPELFAAIGTTYGAGDESTTFNLPNFINRTFWGGTTSGAYLDGTLPNITGELNKGYVSSAPTSGSFRATSPTSGQLSSGNHNSRIITFNASLSSPKYQDGALVRPESVQTRFCIKY